MGASAPEAPTNLRATASGQTQINLEWTAPAQNGGHAISGYKIERSSNGNSNWTNLVADTGNTDTEYTDADLSVGTTRYYRISAINSVGTGPASNVDGATVADTIAPTETPNTWSLIPAGLTNGDSFRLIFGTSTKRNATPTDIETYNTFVQNAAANRTHRHPGLQLAVQSPRQHRGRRRPNQHQNHLHQPQIEAYPSTGWPATKSPMTTRTSTTVPGTTK